MNRRVTRSQVKVKQKPEPKASQQPKDTVPEPKPSTSKSTSSSPSSTSTVKCKSGHSSNSSSLPSRVNGNDTRTRKMKRQQDKPSTAEKTELPPPGKKPRTNDDDDQGLNLDVNYLNMLPPEVWEIIFKEVRDPLDFQTLINSSPSWRKLLEKEKTKFLFPLVFPILLKKKLIDYKNGDAESEVDVNTEDHDKETSMRSKVTKDLKDYRAVCKTWDKGIQDYVQRYYRHAFLSSMKMSGEMHRINEEFEKDDPRIIDNYNYTREIEYHLNAKSYVFSTDEKMSQFMLKFGYEKSVTRNQFLTGCVVISDFQVFRPQPEPVPLNYNYAYNPPPPPPPLNFPIIRPEFSPGPPFLRSTMGLLRNYGHHIQYLTLELGHILDEIRMDFQTYARYFLHHTTNLKGLILKYKGDDRKRLAFRFNHGHFMGLGVPDKPDIDNQDRAEIDRKMKENAQLWHDHFPKLSHLQYLEVYNVPGIVFDGIVAKAPLLSKVSIQLMRQSEASYGDYFNLKSNEEAPQRPLFLNMNIRSRDDLLNSESSLKNGISLKIESLCIRFYQYMKLTDWKECHKHWDRPFEFGYKPGWRNRFVRDNDPDFVRKDNYYSRSDFLYVPEKDQLTDEWPEWSRLFRVVELLGAESLLKLSIRLPAIFEKGGSKRILAECPDLRLNLSKLKSLVIQIPNTTSIDFLLGMKNTLEEATLILTKSKAVMSYEDRLKEQIKFNGYFHIMTSSNIWSEMPKLKKLILRVAEKGTKSGTNLKEYNYERPS